MVTRCVQPQVITGLTHPPGFLVIGPDGNVWSGEELQYVARIAYGSGWAFSVTEVLCPGGLFGSVPSLISADGTYIYGLDSSNQKVYKVSTGGTPALVATFTDTIGATVANSICLGPDGNQWIVTNTLGGGIWKMTPGGSFTHYTAGFGSAQFGVIVSDGTNLWATDAKSGHLGIWKISTAGTGTFFADSTAALNRLCWDGSNLYATATGYYAKITTAGAFTWYSVGGGVALGALCPYNGGLAICDVTFGGGGWYPDADKSGTLGPMHVFAPDSGVQEIPDDIIVGPDGRLVINWQRSGIGYPARILDYQRMVSVI